MATPGSHVWVARSNVLPMSCILCDILSPSREDHRTYGAIPKRRWSLVRVFSQGVRHRACTYTLTQTLDTSRGWQQLGWIADINHAAAGSRLLDTCAVASSAQHRKFMLENVIVGQNASRLERKPNLSQNRKCLLRQVDEPARKGVP